MYNISRWTSSPLLRWIEKLFGVSRLWSGTAKEWDEWTVQYKKNHPCLNFIYNTIDKIQDIIQWPFVKLDNVLYYLRYKYIKKTHYVPTYLPPGMWYDPNDRLIHSMFSLLVDFVEIDKAHMQKLCDKNSYRVTCPWYSNFRSRELGLKYLEWECTLTGENGRYASNAKEQLELYNWWTNVRLNRPDPYESTGYNAYCDTKDWDVWNNSDEPLQYMLRKIREIQNEYAAEDTVMMMRLVRIRESLWT